MALASNTRDQLSARVKRNLAAFTPEWTLASASDNGDPTISVTDETATLIAVVVIRRKTFIGLNVVAELSSSAGEGLPEHDSFVALLPSLSPTKTAKLIKAVAAVGTASLRLIEDSTPTAAECIDANVTAEIANSPEYGHVGL